MPCTYWKKHGLGEEPLLTDRAARGGIRVDSDASAEGGTEHC
jgi:hypothetical protein